MKLVARQCVVVGSLNPAILRPEWVTRNGILRAKGNDPEFKVGFSIAGGISAQYTFAGITWIPSQKQLKVDATPDANPGEFVAKVFEFLVHTPITGVGNNFSFEHEDSDNAVSGLVHNQLLNDLREQGFPVVGHQLSTKLSHGADAIINMNLSFDDSSRLTEISFNFHRDVNDAKSATRAASQWLADKEQAHALVERIEGMSS